MKFSIFTSIALLASAAIAQPHRHQHKHVKKDAAPMVIVTEMVSTTTTIGVTTTIWVTPGQEIPQTSTPASSAPTTAPTTTVVPSYSQPAAQFFEPEASKSSSAPVVQKPATSTVAPVSSSSLYVAPVASVSSVSSVAPVVVPTTSAAPVVIPTTTAPVVQPATTSSAAPVATSAASGSSSGGSGGGSYGGKCTEASPCTGSTSYYEPDVGYTSCGDLPGSVKGESMPIVAMSSTLMGSVSNGNPLCGKTITVLYNGAHVVATIKDKCPSCEEFGLDLSHAAFGALTPNYQDLGRVKTSWWFN